MNNNKATATWSWRLSDYDTNYEQSTSTRPQRLGAGDCLTKTRTMNSLVSQASLFFYEGARAEGGGKKSLVT